MSECPRCGGDMHEVLPMNALSRYDNATYICSPCGVKEAMWDFEHRNDHAHMPPVNEPL